MGPSSTFLLSIDVRHLRAAHQRAPRPGAPVRWGWLAFVAAAHAAGIGWLAGSGTDRQHAVETIVSVRLIDSAPTNAFDASAQPYPATERTVDRPGYPTRPPARTTPVEPGRQVGRTREPPATKQVARSPADVALRSDTVAIASLPSPPTTTAPVEPAPAHDPPAADSEHGIHAPLAKAIPSVVPGTGKAGSSAEPPSTPLRQLPTRSDVAFLDKPKPAYPAAARHLGEEGTVVLRVHVMRDGRPQGIEIFATSGSARLDQAAVDAVRRSRFLPAREGDEAIESWLRIPFEFRLDGEPRMSPGG